MAQGWQAYVQSAQALGFNKCTLIYRQNYQAIAYTAASDVATAWMDGDKQVNENQELLDDWKDQKKATFSFYGKKFNIVTRDQDDGTYVVCSKGKEICLAREFKTIWFICYANLAYDENDANSVKPQFNSARAAFAKIGKVWDQLEEAGV